MPPRPTMTQYVDVLGYRKSSFVALLAVIKLKVQHTFVLSSSLFKLSDVIEEKLK